MVQRYLMKVLFSFAFAVASCNAVAKDAEVAEPAKYTVAALGDSITMAFNAQNYFADSPEVSWSTGFRRPGGFESHLEKLEKKFPGTKVLGYNYAVTGARIRDLASQVRQANLVRPDYVTLLLGANDVCNWRANYQSDLDYFVATLKKNLDTLVAANPDVKILVSSVPDVYRVWELSKDSSACQRVWSFIGLCSPLLGSDVSAAARLDFRDRWSHLNSSLDSVAALYPKNIKFSASLATYEFKKDDISTNDCFHPSLKGQSSLARVTWSESWFVNTDLQIATQDMRLQL